MIKERPQYRAIYQQDAKTIAEAYDKFKILENENTN